ncbi:hypothetical protein C451_19928 [Halococcus thailandensis JCM 13552]|uniref:Uncharacterized protein n=1 Tax=Halococcus thailandensis JCM 13552 TaxID=1227457 RepID=M0MU25_9EURY|nr:hypothetical protein C451_19928 [Halococcus thailandensis JCM 13552]
MMFSWHEIKNRGSYMIYPRLIPTNSQLGAIMNGKNVQRGALAMSRTHARGAMTDRIMIRFNSQVAADT